MENLQVYKASEKVNYVLAIIFFPILLLSGYLCGWCLHQAYINGIYYIGITALLWSIPAAVLYSKYIELAHCRSKIFVVLFSIMFGGFIFVSFYHVGMISAVGVSQAHRIDGLPNFIEYRLDHDSSKEGKSQPYENRFFALLDLLALSCLICYSALQTLKKPYDEENNCWYSYKVITCDVLDARDICNLITSKNFTDISKFNKIEIPRFRSSSFTSIILFYSPIDLSLFKYIGIKEVGNGNRLFEFNAYLGALGTEILPIQVICDGGYEVLQDLNLY